MNPRIRRILALVIVLSSAALVAVAALRLIAPDVLVDLDMLGPGLAERVFPPPVCAALGLATGLAGVMLGLLGRALPPTVLRCAAIIVAASAMLLTPGGMIPVAGYTFAMVVIVGLVVLTALLVRRHPWWGLALIIVLAGIMTWAIARLHGAELARAFIASFGGVFPGALLAAAHLLLAVALVVHASAGRRDAFGWWVLRHRIAITIIAAACALPYTIARVSWLTPWPLLAPDAVDLADMPMVLLTGLSLGAAMLAGGVLTLGLILPWGRRFPRWMAGVGGRPVPVALAVVPASMVAALFTAGGVDLILSVADGGLGDGSLVQVIEFVLVFPFWLWGPLLALATWGYAMARRSDAATIAGAERVTHADARSHPPVFTRQPRVAKRASM